MEFEKVKSVLENLSDDDLLSMWNDYTDLANYSDSRVFNMYELDDIFYDSKASDVLNKIDWGSFNLNDEYFIFNGYGLLESSDDLADFVYIDDLARYIVNNDETFDNAELEELFEEDEENEDDEDGEQDE